MAPFTHWVRDWLARSHRAREIESLSDRDVRELGIDRNTLRELASHPADVPERMSRMARVFGVDPAAIHRQRGRGFDMTMTCGLCRDRKACARELFGDAPSSPERCGFCPNAAAFRNLAAERAAA
jgi:hypothetical protein